MDLKVATSLIKPSVTQLPAQLWWDLGAGSGLFTTALAGLLTEGTIVAMDRDVDVMKSIPAMVGKIKIIKQEIDFTTMTFSGTSPSGILMANSLHFVKDKVPFLETLKSRLAANGVLVIVEYEMTSSNPWVPYPVDFSSLVEVATESGFESVHKIATAPSKYQQDGIYSALVK